MRALDGAPDGGVLAELTLEVLSGPAALPPLLERFRGGTAVMQTADAKSWTVPVERWFLWICTVKRGLELLETEVAKSGLTPEEKDKIRNDIKVMRGTLTTFNVLFRDKEDHFVGQKGV